MKSGHSLLFLALAITGATARADVSKPCSPSVPYNFTSCTQVGNQLVIVNPQIDLPGVKNYWISAGSGMNVLCSVFGGAQSLSSHSVNTGSTIIAAQIAEDGTSVKMGSSSSYVLELTCSLE